MANLNEAGENWETGIYQIEKKDPVIAGAPNVATKAGVTNIPHQQLANRTSWLKSKVDALTSAIAELQPFGARTDKPATTQWVGRELGNYREGFTLSGNISLSPSDVGKFYLYGGSSNITVTVPVASSAMTGGTLTIHNTGTGSVNVEVADGGTVDVGGAARTSITVRAGQTAVLVRASSSTQWHMLNPFSETGFDFSFGNNGWQRLPSGLIVQWGITGAFDDEFVSFPISFPNSVFSIVLTDRSNEPPVTEVVGYYSPTTSGFYLNVSRLDGSQPPGGVGISYMAIGH